MKTYAIKAVDKVRVTNPILRHWNGGYLLGLVGGRFWIHIGKDLSRVTGGAVEAENVGRFRKRLEKLMDKKSIEGLLKGLVMEDPYVTEVAAGVCLGNGLQKAARLVCSPEEGSLIATVESRVLGELDQSDPGQQFL